MAEYHSSSQAPVLPGPKLESEDCHWQVQIPMPAPPVNPPAIFPTEPTPYWLPDLLEDDGFVLVEESSLVLPRTPETPTSVTSNPQTETANAAALPLNSLFKCPGCNTDFHPFSALVIHIERGACSSASKSQQINNAINAFAVQLLSGFSQVNL